MKAFHLFLSIAPIALACPAWASPAAVVADAGGATAAEQSEAPSPEAKPEAAREVFSTGVAKGRDILDAAISTSSIRESQVQKLSARSLTEIFHNIAGVRSEVSNGEVNNNITVRGLPMASTGAKFLQLQEDGLPVVEFGDMITGGADMFLRADLNLSQVEAIRGGSASTFASNSPAGIINLMSKTGDVEGGSLMLSTGIDYEEYRADFDYGAKISDTLRFHVGGFYRQGEGPRRAGYDAVKGGQLKFNITKEFTGGHIRLYGKFLDDRAPAYLPSPITVTGNPSDLTFTTVPGFDANKDAFLSPYIASQVTQDENNKTVTRDIREGIRSKVKSVGAEAQFDIGEWTITDRFRYSDISGRYITPYPAIKAPAGTIAALFGGPGATLRYATGPNKGQLINDPALNGNGLIAAVGLSDNELKSFDNVTNDFRATRVWNIGGGDLTTTAGFYKSRQSVETYASYSSVLSDVVGGGKAALVDISTATGIPLSENGYYSYDGVFFGGFPRKGIKVHYDTNAAFGSLNFKTGPLAIGGSLRYDFGSAKGVVSSYALSGSLGSFPKDVNGNGVISAPEANVGFLPATTAPVDYNYHYLSYSAGVNYRVAEPFAVFARYSRGARANADRLLFSAAVNPADGSLANRDALIDYVKQAEAGFKFREANFSLNATAFMANTLEHNSYFGPIIDRKYKAYGVELESSYRAGIFNITAGATYTHAEISNDRVDTTVIGNKPAGAPTLFGYITPEISTELFSVGANFYGITSRFATDTNDIKMPGYVLVNPFVQVRPVKNLTVAVNVNNLFNTKGITTLTAPTPLAANIGGVTVINGRTISGSVRFDF